MRYHLNNWQNRDHAIIYSGLAMFDPWADGIEGKRAQQMSPGDRCLIRGPAGRDAASIGQYIFRRVAQPIEVVSK